MKRYLFVTDINIHYTHINNGNQFYDTEKCLVQLLLTKTQKVFEKKLIEFNEKLLEKYPKVFEKKIY